MKAGEAVSFEHRSVTHEAILAMKAGGRGCQCEAYRDWFTYARWKAQGYQVQKGEKGVQLTTFQTKRVKDKDTGKEKVISRPWRSYVFCRCQVAKVGED